MPLRIIRCSSYFRESRSVKRDAAALNASPPHVLSHGRRAGKERGWGKLRLTWRYQPEYGPVLKLRDHPRVQYLGKPTWPPVWTRHAPGGTTTLTGEIGVLKYVFLSHGPSSNCILVIEHEHEIFVGRLFLDDRNFGARLCSLIGANTGRTIQEIGDLEIP
jgi:hypothetical protein